MKRKQALEIIKKKLHLATRRVFASHEEEVRFVYEMNRRQGMEHGSLLH